MSERWALQLQHENGCLLLSVASKLMLRMTHEPRSKLLAWRRDIDLGVIVFLVSPIVLQIKPNVRIRLSGLGLLHGWEILEVLGSSTTLVLEMPRLGSWLDCAWL